MRAAIGIFVIVMGLGLFTCYTSNDNEEFYAKIRIDTIEVKKPEVRKIEVAKPAKPEKKSIFFYIDGIDDACDTTKFKCVKMFSWEYDSILYAKKKLQYDLNEILNK